MGHCFLLVPRSRSRSSLQWLVFQLASAGASKSSIARHLGLNRKTVDRWLDPALEEVCSRYSRASYQKHLVARRAAQKAYRESNKEYFTEKNRRYQAQNPSTVRAASTRWREANRDKLRLQAKSFYNGDKLHSSLSPEQAHVIRRQYEEGASSLALAPMYNVGPKAIAGAIRWAGGQLRSKVGADPLGDSLRSFLDGHATRPTNTPVLFYLNTTVVPGAFKAGITNEPWSVRAAKNKCQGVVYSSLLETWALPSRFHGWCVEACWGLLPRPSSAEAAVFRGMNGRTEIRAGDTEAVLALVDEWCRPFVGDTDGPESRLQCAVMALLHMPSSSLLAKKLEQWVAAQLT